ncbi:hypothetical protein CDFC105_60914 [Clostridioides difficile]|nr:hypothetical protein CDFC105_60914 [Clostridioides difficile]
MGGKGAKIRMCGCTTHILDCWDGGTECVRLQCVCFFFFQAEDGIRDHA